MLRFARSREPLHGVGAHTRPRLRKKIQLNTTSHPPAYGFTHLSCSSKTAGCQVWIRRLTGGFYNRRCREVGESAWNVLEAQVGRLT